MQKNNKGVIKHSKKGFIIDQTRKINQLIDASKIRQANMIVDKLLIEYPNDFGLFELKARIYSITGDYRESLRWLNKCEERFVFFRKTIVAIKIQDEELLRILYEKYYKDKNYDIDIAPYWSSNFINFQSLKMYLKKMFEPDKLANYSTEIYAINQILNYDESKAIEHITDRHVKESSEGSSYFREDFDVTEWLPKIKELIEQNKDKARISNFQEEYIIHFPDCGYDSNNIAVNYILVATIYNSSDIVTMYPFRPNSEIPSIEIPKAEEKSNVKVKRLSQSDKFNKRYGIK